MEEGQQVIVSTELWEDMPGCPEHNGEVEDCEGCGVERTEAAKRLHKIEQSIQDRMRGLAQHGVQMPDTVRHEIQLQVLVEMLCQTPRQAALYQGEVMTRMLNAIKNMQEQMKAPTLHVAKPGDLAAMREAMQGR